jgi:hypothetical protein
VSAGWKLAGVADFNRNGKTDYLLFKASTHRSAIWYPSEVIFVGGVYELTFANGYELKGAADFNGGAYGPTLPPAWNLVAP